MLKFVDLKTGYLYDGVAPYVHWFPGEQSTNLIYTHKICFISDMKTISASSSSNVFKLINPDMLHGIIEYNDIITNNIELHPIGLSNGYNIFILYISAQSNSSGEYRTSIILNDGNNDIEVILGADFYMENESLYINLSNMGTELPDSIQKALYSVNIKEGYRDNITLNRKIKELLSNYWDVLANKGSYKSLLNSLKWFEWGDLIRLQEIWKHEDFGKTIYDDRSLCSILEDKYLDTLNDFAKTTHISLYLSMQELYKDNGKTIYDEELNPILKEKIIPKWTREDLMLKICLLGNFYSTYFMPIHLNLLHSTIEDVVFSNTFKNVNSMLMDRHDMVNNIHTFNCNIKDNDSFILNNVQCQVGPNTMFGTNWSGESVYKDVIIMGVDEIADFQLNGDQKISDNELKTFYSQLFNGVGVIIPFSCDIEASPDDYIIESKLFINNTQLTDNTLFFPINDNGNYKFKVKFNLLFQQEDRHKICIQFKTAGSLLYTKTFNINICDVSGLDLKIYKVKHYKYLDDNYLELFKGKELNNYMLSRYPGKQDIQKFIVQYIPTTSSIKTSGVCLNNILVLKGNYINDYILKQYYFMTLKDGREYGDPVYTICISKGFWFDPAANISNFKKTYLPVTYRNDYGFFPEFHYLEEIQKDKLKSYEIYDEDVIAVIPELPLGLEINDWDWEFINISRNEIIQLHNYQEPYVANLDKNPLSTGYYDVKFKYKIGQEIKEITRQSVFVKIQ